VHEVPPPVAHEHLGRRVLHLEQVDLLFRHAEFLGMPALQRRVARDRPAHAVLPALVDQLPQLKAADRLVVADVEVALTLEAMVAIPALVEAPLVFGDLLRAVRGPPARGGRVAARVVAADLLERIHQLIGGELILFAVHHCHAGLLLPGE
jgi:hypothetical protein